MAGRIRWLGIVMVRLLPALFLQLNNVQVENATTYATSAAQPVGDLGPLRPAPGRSSRVPTASCWPSRCRPRAGPTSTCAQYPDGLALRPDHRVPVLDRRLATGVERHLRQLSRPSTTGPSRPSATCSPRPTETDTVTLTLSSKLQETAQTRPSTAATAPSSSSTPPPGRSWPCTPTPPTTPTRWPQTTPPRSTNAYKADTTKNPTTGLRPGGVARLSGLLPARVDVQGRDGHGRVSVRAQARRTPPCPTSAASPTTTSAGRRRPLCNDGGSCVRGDHRRDAAAVVRPRVRPPRHEDRAPCRCRPKPQSFGFNQQPPIDLPHSPSSRRTSSTPPAGRGAPRSSWPSRRSARTAPSRRRCRWRWWRPGSPTAGVVMTPHVMYEIRDSQNNLVEQYQPTAVAPGRLAGDGERHDQPHGRRS